MTNTLAKTITHPDGSRRIVIESRSDGLFEYEEEEYRLLNKELDHWKWIPEWRRSGLFASIAEAEKEARSTTDWLGGKKPWPGKYGAMTVNERLFTANAMDEFHSAMKRRDRPKLLELLIRVELSDEQADQAIDALFANPERYGYDE